jgi:hypothetical protein
MSKRQKFKAFRQPPPQRSGKHLKGPPPVPRKVGVVAQRLFERKPK